MTEVGCSGMDSFSRKVSAGYFTAPGWPSSCLTESTETSGKAQLHPANARNSPVPAARP